MTDYPKAPRGSAAEATFKSLKALGIRYAGATAEGGRFQCPNPGHEDDRPSCDVTIGRKGKPLFNCKPCEQAMGQAEYIDALRSHGVKWHGDPCTVDDIDWGERAVIEVVRVAGKGKKGDVRLTAVYTYNHEDGSPNFKVLRFDPVEGSNVRKEFRPKRYVRGSGFVTGIEGVERTPLNLDRFEEWSGGVLYIVEGEKAVDALVGAGRAATTFFGGANGKVEPDWVTRYNLGRFKVVRVWPDADEAGVERAKALVADLAKAGVNAALWGVPAEHLNPHDDAYDVLERGQTRLSRVLVDDDLKALIALSPAPKRVAVKGDKAESPKSAPESLEVGGVVFVSAEPFHGAPAADDEPLVEPYGVVAGVQPYVFADEMIERHFQSDDGTLTLRYHADKSFWLWDAGECRYVAMTEDEIKSHVSRLLDDAEETTPDGEVRLVKTKTSTVRELVEALRSRVLASKWGGGVLLPARGGVPFRNGWLDVETGELLPIGPDRDVRWNVPLDYEKGGGSIKEWEKFLASVGWERGTEEYRLLQQWFGYLLSGDKSQQKAMVLVGPTRSGKGTILNVAAWMLGDGAIGTQMDMLADKNGLENVVGKGLVTVGDARFSFRTDKGLVGRLLSLIADDEMTVNAKYKNLISVRLDARLMLATNELPTFTEASDALARRFIVLEMSKSFLGHEDLTLARRLRKELPGIVAWALDGYRELVGLGSFAQTTTGRELQEQMVKDAAPIRVFIEDECEFGSEFWIEKQALYDEYVLWARQNGLSFILSKPQFFRDLNTAFPGKTKSTKPRIGQKQIPACSGLRLKRGV